MYRYGKYRYYYVADGKISIGNYRCIDLSIFFVVVIPSDGLFLKSKWKNRYAKKIVADKSIFPINSNFARSVPDKMAIKFIVKEEKMWFEGDVVFDYRG